MSEIQDDSYNGLEIAVIGLAGRFPGAKNIDEYWENLKKGVESIYCLSDEELLQTGIDADTIKHPNYVKLKGLLEEVESFDSSFFSYTPRESKMMDPQFRILHECTYEALENS